MIRRWGIIALTATIVAAGCSSSVRYRVLSTLFDGVPAPGETAAVEPAAPIARAPAPPAIEPRSETPAPQDVAGEAVRAAPRPGEHYSTYGEVEAEFPKDSMGNVDWVAAARSGLIDPRPSVDPAVAARNVLPYDVVLDPGFPNFEVVFPHEPHTYWLSCESCHPAIFEMRAGANPITMAKIFEGEYCGRCHGTVAFRPQTGCLRCHTKMAG